MAPAIRSHTRCVNGGTRYNLVILILRPTRLKRNSNYSYSTYRTKEHLHRNDDLIAAKERPKSAVVGGASTASIAFDYSHDANMFDKS